MSECIRGRFDLGVINARERLNNTGDFGLDILLLVTCTVLSFCTTSSL